MSWVAIGTTAAGLIGSQLNKPQMGNVSSTQELSPHQKEAIQQMMDAIKTGRLGGVNLGEKYGGATGSYGMTGLEGMGQNKLAGMMNSPTAMSELYGSGKIEIQNLLGGSYDPYNEKGVYAGFKKNVMKEAGESRDALNRSLGSSGALFSTARVGENRKISENSQDALTNKLGELYQGYGNQRLSAANTALSAGAGETSMLAGIDADKIAMSQQYGALQRQLEDQRAKDTYNEWNRSRNEKLGTTSQFLTSLSGNTGGATTTTQVPEANPWGDFFNTATGIGAGMIGGDYYNKTGMFGKKSPTTSPYSSPMNFTNAQGYSGGANPYGYRFNNLR